MRSWTIGKVRIYQLVEQIFPEGIPTLIPAATPEALLAIPWLYPEFITAKGEATLSFHAFVVETPTKRILIDTCVGSDKTLPIVPAWDHMQSEFLSKLERAGFSRDAIDIVACTHLHLDHVGWNTMRVEGRWQPTFPNARYLFGRLEYEHLLAVCKDLSVDEHWRVCNATVLQESVQPVFDAGLVDLVDLDHVITDEVSLTPTLGHTLGHVSVLIASEGQRAMITGDAIHHPCQIARTEWGTSVDADTEAAMHTRRRILGEAVSSRQLMLGSHWPGAGSGFVARDGDNFRLVIEPGKVSDKA